MTTIEELQDFSWTLRSPFNSYLYTELTITPTSLLPNDTSEELQGMLYFDAQLSVRDGVASSDYVLRFSGGDTCHIDGLLRFRDGIEGIYARNGDELKGTGMDISSRGG